MNRDRWMTALQGALLAFLAGMGAMETLITGFDLPLARPELLWAVCAVVSGLSAGVLVWKHGGSVLLILGALAAWYLKGQETALKQLLELISRISYHYDLVYGTGYFVPAQAEWETIFVDWPVCAWGGAVCALTAVCVSRRWSVFVPALMAGIPVALCYVTTDTPSAAWPLGCLAFSLLMILFTGAVGREDSAQGNRLGLLCALPIAGVLILLALAVPRESYVNQSAQAWETLTRWVRQAAELPKGDGLPSLSIGREEKPAVNLEILGDLNQSRETVLYVRSDVGGALYLRGQDYDTYDGREWRTSGSRAETFSGSGEDLGTLTVQTVGRLETLYLPYYPDQAMLKDGRAENRSHLTDYNLSRRGLPGELYTLLEQSGDLSREAKAEYLALPEGARAELRAIAEPLVQGADSATRKAERIGEYVRSGWRYDKQPPRMNPDAEDFAVWFLKESDRGYCVHFATAAVTLLRSVGVEARYVTGYMIWAQPGVQMAVTGENAHAWAEYYEPRLDLWIPLEATPAERQMPVSGTAQQPENSREPGTVPTQTPKPEEPGAAAEPTAEKPREEEKRTAPTWLIRLLRWLAGCALLAAAAELQRTARLALRRYRCRRGTPNTQALARWREAERLARLLGEKPPEELHLLAQKAKFSQYTLTAEELLTFEGALRRAQRRLSRENRLRKFLYRYFYAVL